MTEDATAETTTDAAEKPTLENAEQQTEPRGNREAARYRTRLREVEAEHQATTEALEATRRALVDMLAQAKGIKPAALWAAGTTLDSLLDDDGNVSTDAVSAALDNAVKHLGLNRTPRPDPSQGATAGNVQPSDPFAAALRR